MSTECKRVSKAALSLAGIIIFLLNVAPGQAQDWAMARLNNSPRHGEWVKIKSGDRTIKAFVVYPERKDKAPVVFVIHEIFGLSDWVRGLCDQLAENGIIAIAPDLLSGQPSSDPDGARKAISALPEPQIKEALDATSDYALKIPAGNGTLAVCGFCWGCGWVFQNANFTPKLKPAYPFSGTEPDGPAKAPNMAVL